MAEFIFWIQIVLLKGMEIIEFIIKRIEDSNNKTTSVKAVSPFETSNDKGPVCSHKLSQSKKSKLKSQVIYSIVIDSF